MEVLDLVQEKSLHGLQMGQEECGYWRDHVYYTFQDDEPGMRCRDLIGADKMLWGSDYPHFDSTWPNSREAIARNFARVSDEEREKILGGNLVEVYHLQDILD